MMKTASLILFLLVSCSVYSKTLLDLYTWRVQEVALWEEINQRNILSDVKINVKVVNFDTYEQHIQLALQSNRPAIFQWAPGASALDPLIKHDLISDNKISLASINPSAIRAATGSNKLIYGVPFAVQLQGLLVNQKLMAKHNLGDAPQTISQLESYFSTLKSHNITPLHMASDDWYLSQVVMEVLVAGLLPARIAEGLQNGQRCFNDSEFTQVLTTLKHWYKKGFINQNVLSEDYQGAGTNVALANSAMVLDGGWRTSPNSVFKKIDPNFEFDFWAVPGDSNRYYAFADGTYQVNRAGRHYDEANQVLRFTTTKQFAELFANTLNELPAYAKPVKINSNNLRQLASLVSSKSYGVSLFTSPGLNLQEPSYQTLTREAISMIFSGKSAKVAAQHIQNGLNSWRYSGHELCR